MSAIRGTQSAHRSRSLFVWLTVVALLTYPVSPAWAHEGHAPLPSHGATLDGRLLLLSESAIEAIDMQMATITLGDIRDALRVNGRIELPFNQQAQVATLMSGRIESILVQPGDRVAAGQELAHVESLELENLQGELLRSKGELELLQKLVEQRKGLADRGTIPVSLLLQTQADLERKAAEHEIARLRLEGWGVAPGIVDEVLASGEPVGSLAITSPIAGIIGLINARPGQLVEETEQLFEVVDLTQVYAVGEVPESEASRVAAGMPVTMTLPGLSQQTFDGTIEFIHLHLHEPQRSLHVVVLLDNPDEKLRPGMFGRMTIEVASATQEILCPLSAIIETDEGAFVLKREAERKFSRQEVELGPRSREFAVIESGLFPGQNVINKGTHLLAAMYEDLSRIALTPESENPQPTTNVSTPVESEAVTALGASVVLPTNDLATATSLIEGRLAEILVKPGQEVQAGDPVATVQSQELRDLQLQFLQTRSRLAWAENEVKRLQPLADSGTVPLNDFWQRQTEAGSLRQDMASLTRRLSLVGVSDEEIQRLREHRLVRDLESSPGTENPAPILDRLTIRAPITGRVAEVFATPGQLVHAHDNLVEIQNTDTVWIKAFLLEEDAPRVQTGQEAEVTFAAHPTLRLTGPVVHVGPTFDSEERLQPVWVEVANPDGFLRNGMLARVRIEVPEAPATAAVEELSRQTVGE
jgi:cobalt-zinc-cadmium efflux system membrane fusion protein